MKQKRRSSRTGGVLTRTLLAIIIGAVAALWTWTAAGDPALAARPGEATTRVHLLNNGFHTDLAVPRAARKTVAAYSTSGDCTVTTTVCEPASRSRVRSHHTAPFLTAQSFSCKPSNWAMVCPSTG